MANKIKIAGTTSNTFTVGTDGTGIITAGTYLYSNGEPISSSSSNSSPVISIVTKSSNTVASTSDVGKMVVHSGYFITYDIPNVSTAGFAVGSRIELLAAAGSGILVGPVGGSGVTIAASKDLNNSTTISNIQSATLTMISTDYWYMGP